MHTRSVTSLLVVLMAWTTAAAAQQTLAPANSGGVAGGPAPMSGNASNMTAADTTSEIAPRLPTPSIDDNAPPAGFLRAARQALFTGNTGVAQEAMERAESRELSRAVRPSLAGQPSPQPLVAQIAAARGALSNGDRLQAIKLLDTALANPAAAAD